MIDLTRRKPYVLVSNVDRRAGHAPHRLRPKPVVEPRSSPVAAEYGIKKEEDVAVFLDLSVMYGEDFHRDEWASDVLADEAIAPSKKVDELRERVFQSGALM